MMLRFANAIVSGCFMAAVGLVELLAFRASGVADMHPFIALMFAAAGVEIVIIAAVAWRDYDPTEWEG